MLKPTDGQAPELWVARYVFRDGGLDALVCADADPVRVHSFRLEPQSGDVALPGRFTVADPDGATLAFEITARGSVFDLILTGPDGAAAKGLGLRDPDRPDALLVSWWSGAVRPAGVVKYEIVGPETIRATYTSVMSFVTGHHEPLAGVATGDTGGGGSPAATASLTTVTTAPSSGRSPGRSRDRATASA